MTDRDLLWAFRAELRELKAAVGDPSYTVIKRYAELRREKISIGALSELLGDKPTIPRPDTVMAFVEGCCGFATARRISLPEPARDRRYWTSKIAAIIASRRQKRAALSLPFALADSDETFLSPRDWERIAEMISGLPEPVTEDRLVQLLWSAADDIAPLYLETSQGLFALLQQLDGRWARPGSMRPSLIVLEYLAAAQRPFAASGIRALVDELAAAAGIPRAELDKVRRRAVAPPDEPGPASLLIKVVPVEAEAYSTTIWLYRDGVPISFKQESPGCAAAQLRSVVEAAIAAIGPFVRGAPLDRLTFEFAMPWNMLDEVVERWCLSNGQAIGELCPVVIRSLERMEDPFMEFEWKRRSSALRDGGDPADLIAQEPARSGRYPLRPETVLLAADGPYKAPPAWQDGTNAILAALKSGIPAVAWLRDGGDRCELTDLLDCVDGPDGLSGLPFALLERRRSETAAPSICLVWDDYHRQPFPTRFRRPVTR